MVRLQVAGDNAASWPVRYGINKVFQHTLWLVNQAQGLSSNNNNALYYNHLHTQQLTSIDGAQILQGEAAICGVLRPTEKH